MCDDRPPRVYGFSAVAGAPGGRMTPVPCSIAIAVPNGRDSRCRRSRIVLGDLRRGEPRHAAIGAARRVAQIHRVQPDFGQPSLLEAGGGDDALIPLVAGEHELVPHGVELGVGGGRRVDLVLLVEIARHRFEQIELKDEVAEAVEDRLAVVDLDAADLMRSVADELVGAGIDRLVRQPRQEVGRLLAPVPGSCA